MDPSSYSHPSEYARSKNSDNRKKEAEARVIIRESLRHAMQKQTNEKPSIKKASLFLRRVVVIDKYESRISRVRRYIFH